MQKLKTGILLLALAFVFVQCTEDEPNEISTDGFPQKFTVDVPAGISNMTTTKSAASDDFSGAEIYEHLRNFVALGEEAAEFIEEVMIGISTYELNQSLDLTYTGDDDRTKHIVVVSSATFEGASYEYQLNLSDLESESNDDGGLALQVFWNGNPVDGVAILKPYNWDRVYDVSIPNTIFRIDYSETGDSNYDETMEVAISNWEYDRGFDRYHMDNLKMFVGKKGDVVDIYGNSNHPEAWLFVDDTIGMDWAFVASGSQSEGIAVAEVGLPWSSIDSDVRSVLLDDYSVKDVLVRQVGAWYKQETGFEPTATMLEPYLSNANAPAYFDATGFAAGGVMPSDSYQSFVDNIATLVPFNPKTIAELELEFKN